MVVSPLVTDSETSVAVLSDVDALLETWCHEWLPWISSGMSSNALVLSHT
jgi:hypothetical protein